MLNVGNGFVSWFPLLMYMFEILKFKVFIKTVACQRVLVMHFVFLILLLTKKNEVPSLQDLQETEPSAHMIIYTYGSS